jgi:hypothetical protein
VVEMQNPGWQILQQALRIPGLIHATQSQTIKWDLIYPGYSMVIDEGTTLTSMNVK